MRLRTMEEISNALKAAELEKVSIETGLKYPTLLRYRRGTVTNPPLDSIQRLSEWMNGQDRLTSTRGR